MKTNLNKNNKKIQKYKKNTKKHTYRKKKNVEEKSHAPGDPAREKTFSINSGQQKLAAFKL